MDQYEDLKKFREKTRMKSVDFVDFTKKNKELNHGQWSIVQQLVNNKASLISPASPDLSPQSFNSSLMNKTATTAHLGPLTTGVHSTMSTTSLLKDVDMQLNRPESFQSEVHSAQKQQQYQPPPASVQNKLQADVQQQLQQPPLPSRIPIKPQADVQQKSQPNFSNLFTASVDNKQMIEKEIPLQSLLKRIATCR